MQVNYLKGMFLKEFEKIRRPGEDSDLKLLFIQFHLSTVDSGRDPFNQTFRKFRSKTQWIGSVQPEKFRKNGSTF